MPVAGKRTKQNKAASGNTDQGKPSNPVSSKTARAPSLNSSTTSLSPVGGSSGAKVAATSSAVATKKRPITCAVCEQKIVDGKDQAIFCEGVCQRWLHRYCAGVSLPYFEAMSSSPEPFYCVGCLQVSYNAEMASLREIISSMRTEITELRETVKEMSTKCSCSQNHDRSSSDGAWKRVERAVRGGRVRGGKSGAEGGKGRNRVCGEGGVRESSGGSKSKSIQGTSSETTKTKGPAERVRVQGARRIWGTMKQTTHTSLKHVILKFCPTISLKIKRKTISDQDGQVKRWWFVIHAPEDVLTTLDTAWEQIQLQTGWKVEL